MILSPIKCFLIQLTLTFVVFFYNTLAQGKYIFPSTQNNSDFVSQNIYFLLI